MIRLCICGLVLASVSNVQATKGADLIYDIKDDWSDVNNPNGAWQLNKAPNSPFTVNQSDWAGNGTNQKAWADAASPGTAHVPAWMKVTNTSIFTAGFVDVGTIVMHGAEEARTGTDLSSLVWTSPLAGTVTITGGMWKEVNTRSMRWEIRKDGTLLSLGDLNAVDPYTKTNPYDFSAGSGGAGAMTFSVSAGTKVELLAYRTSTFASFVGMNYRVTLTPVPEPGTWLLSSLSVATIVFVRSRKKTTRQ
ncbi:PEP-CTERM sorting domain-containing protein [bacterium]|nr:PEP-CTERM sorting domain-containing protein [bacterium]